MNAKDYLKIILGILQIIKEDKQKLAKVHEFMMEEFEGLFSEEEDTEEIPEKLKPLIKEVADWLNCGMICYINPKTFELITIPKDYDPDFSDLDIEEDVFRQELEKIDTEWEKSLSVDPPDSHTAFRFMESFVFNKLPEGKLQNQLINALERKKPFANFNRIIDNSDVREEWFEHKNNCLEGYAYDTIGYLLEKEE
jgi:hypothetical protein